MNQTKMTSKTMQINEEHLRGKGWSATEIERTLQILKEAEEAKHPWIQRLEDNLHWLYLFIAVVGNLALTAVLLPLFLATPAAYLLPVMAVLGITFGAVCTAVFHQLDELDTKHHFLYVVFTFIIGIVGFGFVIGKANQIALQAGVGYQHGALVAITYVASFFIPYVAWRTIR